MITHMKRKLGILLMLALPVLPLKGIAQNYNFFKKKDDNKIFYAGLQAGGNFSTVDGDSYSGYKKAGIVGGATVYVRLLPKLLTNIELLYSQKGSRGVATRNSIYIGEFFEQYWLDLDYIEVPIMLHYSFTPRWHLGAGASYGRLIRSREDIYTDQPVTIDPDNNFFQNDDINVIVGGGFHLGYGWFLLARYQRSTRSIRNANNIPFWQNSIRQYNDLFSLRLMYLIQ